MPTRDIEQSAFRSLMEGASLGIAFTDQEQRLQLVNPALCSMLGYASAELVGRPASHFVDQADHGAEQALLKELASGVRAAFQIEKRFVRKDGTRFWVRASVAPWNSPDSPRGFFSIAVDISDVCQLREDLARNRERISLTIEASRTGIWELDAESGHVSWTGDHGLAAAEQSSDLGTTYAEFLYRVHPEDRGALETKMMAALQTGESFALEFRLIDASDRVRWIHCKGKTIHDSAGNAKGILAVNADITAMKQTEFELHSVMGRLIQAQEDERRRISRELHDDISQRLALLSVELSSFANSLRGRRKELPSAIKRLQTGIDEIARDIHGLSHQLHSIKLQNLGLRAALRELCQQVSEQHGIAVSMEASNLAEAMPEDVALCLFRVAQEAINNVVKHSHAREASIAVSQKGNLLKLTVSDPGVGFNPASRSSGIGLAGMRERMRFVGGTLAIRSAAGRGTEITAEVRIPGVAKSAAAGGGSSP